MAQLTKQQLQAIYGGLAKANLGDYRIVTLHLAPVTPAGALTPKDAGQSQPDLTNLCHSTQLPTGGYVITCGS